MPETLVTVRTYTFLPEAEAARMYLETEGIQTFLADAETVNMDWLLGNALGYIKLQVPSDRAQEAVALLDRGHLAQMLPDDEEADPEDDGVCLACGASLREGHQACDACGWSYQAADAPGAEPPEEEPAAAPSTASAGVMANLRSFKVPLLILLLTPLGYLAFVVQLWLMGVVRKALAP